MAQYRQSGTERYGALHHHHHHNNNNSNSNFNGKTSFDNVSIGIRAAPYGKQSRVRRSARADKSGWRFSTLSGIIVLSLVLFVTLLAYLYISGFNNDDDTKEINTYQYEDDDSKNDLDFLTNVTRTDTDKVLQFGKGSVAHGRDSRYWDKDDRRRDDDYNEDVVEHVSTGARGEYHRPVKVGNKDKVSSFDMRKDSERKGVGLYNEAGRNELKMYEAEYEASLNSDDQSGNGNGKSSQESNGNGLGVNSQVADMDDGYDDGLELHDSDYDDTEHDNLEHSDVAKVQNDLHQDSSDSLAAGTKYQNTNKVVKEVSENLVKDSSLSSQILDSTNGNSHQVSTTGGRATKPPKPKRKSKRRSCEMKLANSSAQLVEPIQSRKFVRFSLQYKEVEEKPEGEAEWEPRFAGHQSLQEREESFVAQDQKINCGFVNGPKGYPSTGFDLSEDDANYISRCHIAVVSCIFGNSDRLRTPAGKTFTRSSRKNACFVMFMDELTLQTLTSEGQVPDRTGFIGLWKIVVVKNLPYTDMRRVGKIPKLLPHRLFPFARYSIWLDSKLRLQLNPVLILEYFLWRKGHEYAISNHYDRHCVWEEVAQNKKLNKYNHTVIDEQFEFYQADGLTRFNASDPDKLLPSNVPEGSFIVRAHTPMSNLFSCLWFNEVDRFTPRDQLSFAYTYQKLRRMNPGKPFYFHMFKDCERRSIAKLFRHRAEEKRNIHREAAK